MKISFENFAKAGTGDITVNKLTVICGPNNTGKTFLNYGVFSIIENIWKHFNIDFSEEKIRQVSKEIAENDTAELKLENLKEKLQTSIKNIGTEISSEFYNYFKSPKDHFQDLKIKLDFDDIYDISAKAPYKYFYPVSRGRFFGEYIHEEKKIVFTMHYDTIRNGNGDSEIHIEKNNIDYSEDINKLIKGILYNVFIFPKISVPFPITSERTGISLFHKIYDFYNDRVVRKIEEDNSKKSIGEELASKHAIPIQRNIDRVRFFENVVNDESFIYEDTEEYKDIIDLHSEFVFGGSFHVDNGVIMFHPPEDSIEPKIQIHLASSSLKAHLILDIFIKNIAKKNSMLFIDEPELNLYPANQAKMARLIAKLVNAGVKVMVTTHSDFFIREINNLIALGCIKDTDLKTEVMQDFDIKENDILDVDHVSAYMTTKDKEIKKMEVDKGGINTEILNSVILDENEKSNIIIELLERESENE